MIIPGFTAEASIYRTAQSYRATTGGSLGLTGQSITPQLDCSSKCIAAYTACFLGCAGAGGFCIPACALAFGSCEDGCSGGGGGGGGPAPNPRCGCPPGTVCQGGCVKEPGVGLICNGDCVSTRRLS
jgi:hypothetical protein